MPLAGISIFGGICFDVVGYKWPRLCLVVISYERWKDIFHNIIADEKTSSNLAY